MKKIIILLMLVLSVSFSCFFQRNGSDPTMDYGSLKGSGLTPQEYDDLVKKRQLQYTNEIYDEDV